MKCAEVQALLPTLLGAPTTQGAPGISSDLQEHLDTCPDCQKLMDKLSLMWTRLDHLPREEMPDLPMPDAVVEDLRAIALARQHRGAFWLTLTVVILATAWQVPWRQKFALPLLQGPFVTLALFGAGLLALLAGMRLSRLVRWKALGVLGLCVLVLMLHLTLSPSLESPFPVAGHAWGIGAMCILGGTMVAFPVILACAWSLRGARLPNLLSAALIGAGSGLFGMGVLHYECPTQATQFHLIFHHGGAAVLVLIAVLVTAAIVSSLTLGRSRRSLR